MGIHSIEIERQSIAAILKYPKKYLEIANFINDEDYCNNVHRAIFWVIRDLIVHGESVDIVVVGNKIKSMNISFEKEDITIPEYLNACYLTSINPDAVISIFQELKKISIARSLYDIGGRIQREIKSNINLSSSQLITLSDSIYNKTINLYHQTDNPTDLFSDMKDLIEEKGNSPVEENGLVTPYPCYNRFFGGFRNGNVYAIASRTGQGKSTWLMDVAFKTANIVNKDIKVLYLDTELCKTDMQLRLAASISGVPFWYLDTGNWRKHQDFLNKTRRAWDIIKNNQYKFFHHQVSNMPIDQICMEIKRWFYSHVGRGGQALIVYDYLKITGESVSNDYKEYQVMEDKVNRLKEIADELNVPVLTAVQINRSGIASSKQGMQVEDSESVISLSDRISWIGSYLGIFRRKTLEEIAQDGEQFGTHKLITLKGRFQGRESQGHIDFVKVPNSDGKPKYQRNYINFDVTNFNVEERGCLYDMVASHTENLPLTANPDPEPSL